MNKVVIFGAGVMGTALGIHLADANEVTLWGTAWDDARIRRLRHDRSATGFPVDIQTSVHLALHDDPVCLEDANLLILAVTSEGLDASVRALARRVSAQARVAAITKGFDPQTKRPVTAVIRDALRESGLDTVDPVKIAGPLRAVELASGVLSSAVFASAETSASEYCREVFAKPNLWAEVSTDPIGVDVASAFKNAYAIWIGIVDALWPMSDNPKAAVVAQAVKELGDVVRLAGGAKETVLGPAGIGDFHVTISGGRNLALGRLIGSGMSLSAATEQMQGQTVEGVAAVRDGLTYLHGLSQKSELAEAFPLLRALHRVLFQDERPLEVLHDFMTRK